MKSYNYFFRSACYLIIVIIITAVFFNVSRQAQAAAGVTSTFLGKIYSGDGGQATDGYLDMPKGITYGQSGSLMIADTLNNVIRKIDVSGVITTYSGNGDYGIQDGPRAKATWSEPEGITYDGQGIFYIADTGSSRIRKIRGDVVSTIPIKGLSRPNAVVISGSTLYISDTGNNRIVKVGLNGGEPNVIAGDVSTPLKMVLSKGKLYVTELNRGNLIAIDLATKIKTILASGFTEPRAIAYYNGFLYLTAGPSGMYNEIWRIDPKTGEKTMLVRRLETELLNQTSDMVIGNWAGEKRIVLLQSGGSSIQTTDIDGDDLLLMAGRHRYGDEPLTGSKALIGRPQEIVFSPDGTKLYISYAQGNKIDEYNLLTDQVRTVAGHLMDNYREGVGETARFSDVVSMAISNDGKTLYLADRNSHRIRTLDVVTGATHYLTGAGVVNLISPQNPSGNIDVNLNNGYQEGGPCPDTYSLGVKGCAYFNRPTGLALTKDGKTLYVADASNNRIRKVDVLTGYTSLIAGSGKKGMTNGVGSAASFNGPYTIALSSNEKTLYVADKYNNVIRAIDLKSRRVTTLAGTGKQGYREGAFANAVFSLPEYIDIGPDQNLYVSEAGSFRIRKLNLANKTTSLISGSGERGWRDGNSSTSKWNAPKGIAFLLDVMFVADFKNDLIRTINLEGQLPGPQSIPVAKALTQFFAFDTSLKGGFSVGAGDVNNDGKTEIIIGSSAGSAPQVKIFDTKGNLLTSFYAYNTSLKTGIRVAGCDLNGDGSSEIITIPAKGAKPHIRIFDQNGQSAGTGFFALNGQFRGGTSLACGDVTGDGKADIVVSALEGGEPQVTIYDAEGKLLGSFMAYDKKFRLGIEIGLADLDGNGVKEVITVPSHGVSQVQIFSGTGKRLSPGFFTYETTYRNGSYVAGGDANGDGKDEILISAGGGRINEVRLYNKRGQRVKIIRPYVTGMRGGVIIAADDINSDSKDELLTIPASAGTAQLRVISIL